jgi:hypothetical protein
VIIKNKNKLSITIIVAAFLITSTIVPAQIINNYKKENNEISDIAIAVTFSENDLIFETFDGYDVVYLKDGGVLNDIGKPLLPIKNILVALPENMKATNVRILSNVEKELSSVYNILPAQEPQKIGISIGNPTFIKDDNIYQSEGLYPSKIVELKGMTDLAGQAIALITIYPLQYSPSLKTLKLHTNINFVIEGETGYVCGDYLPVYISETELKEYQEKVKDLVINPEDVILKTNKDPQPCSVDPDDYDYVIITQDSWVSAFQPLADWKTQKGIPTNIVTTEWIYNSGGYSGTDVQKIKAFVQDVYTNWGTTYVLLGGDINVVPCHYRTFPGVDSDPVPNDVYYADFDSDWICEVNIGRASVTGTGNGTGQIGNFINKILTYETNPPLTNYAMNAGFFGFNLDGSTPAEQCKIDIKNSYIPSSWTVTTVYDSQGGNHQTNVINALNAGQNLVNHADHSNSDCMGTGYVNHDWLIYNSDTDALTNGNKQTILYSMGCDPAAYDVSNCIAEHFVRNSNGGGIAFIGNSRYGWYNPGYYDTLSMEFDVHFFKSLFQENLYHLGAAFTDHKNDVMQSHSGDDYYQYCYTELTLLGDPELPVWKNNPASFDVTHPDEIPVGSSSFTVHIETTNGSNLQNAYVCLWKSDEVYLTGYTNSNGNVTFNPSPTTTGIMTVTVTKQDYLPYEGNVTVVIPNIPPNAPSNPNPPDDSTGVDINADLSWTCSDPDGDSLIYNVYFGTTTNPPIVSFGQFETTYNPGTMNFDTNYYWKIKAIDIHGASTMGPLWNFETEGEPLNYPPEFSNENPSNGATNVTITTSLISIYISDTEGDSFTCTIETSPNVGSVMYANVTNGTKTCDISGLEYNTIYTWYVNATDSGSGQTTSEIYTFTTESASNNPPNKPNIDGPLSGNIGISYTYTFTSTDPDEDDIQYYIYWGDGTITDWTSFQASGSSYSDEHTWSISGNYIIKAKAKDTNGAESDWGTLSITMPLDLQISKQSSNQLLLKMMQRFLLQQ